MAEHLINDYYISSQKEKMDFLLIYEFISSSYWAKGISVTTLKTALENSICFGVFARSGAQVGFARVVTDFATFGYLADVFILETHRKKGLSKWLMKTICEDSRLQGFRRFMLVTQDAHALYEQFGFEGLAYPETYMEKWNPQVYEKQ